MLHAVNMHFTFAFSLLASSCFAQNRIPYSPHTGGLFGNRGRNQPLPCHDFYGRTTSECNFNGLEQHDLPNGFNIFAPGQYVAPQMGPYKNAWRRVEVGSRFFNQKGRGYLDRFRHPWIMIADEDPQNTSGALGIELTAVSPSSSGRELPVEPGFYLGIESHNKPRQKSKYLLSQGFQRHFACYTNVDLSDAKFMDIFRKFNERGMGYSVGLNNCQHFADFALEMVCGKHVAQNMHRSHPLLGLAGVVEGCVRQPGPKNWDLLFSPPRTEEEILNPRNADDNRQTLPYQEDGYALAGKRSSPFQGHV